MEEEKKSELKEATVSNIPEEHPITPPTKKPALPIIIIGAVILLLVGTLGGSYAYSNQAKTDIKDLSKKQVENLNQIRTIYADIVSTLKTEESTEEQSDNELLIQTADKKSSLRQRNSQTQEVLGLEDSESIKASRKLSEIYKRGSSETMELQEINQQISQKLNPFTAIFIPKATTELVNKTNTYASQTKALFKYFEETNKVDIRTITLGYEMGVALGAAIEANATETSVRNFEDKVEKIKALKKEYEAIDISTLPKDIQDTFKKQLDSSDEYFVKLTSTLDDITEDLRNKDGVSLSEHIQALYTDSISTSDIALVDTISFLQENSLIRSTETLKKDWEKHISEL